MENTEIIKEGFSFRRIIYQFLFLHFNRSHSIDTVLNKHKNKGVHYISFKYFL